MKYLFLGGPWDGRVEEVDPLPHLVLPSVRRCGELPWDVEFSQHTYTAHRFYLRPPSFQHGPSQAWRVYVTGPMPDPDHVMRLLYQLDVPPESR